MGFKKYIIASFTFLILIAIYVANISDGDFTVKIVELGIHKTYPIYFWVILPALVLFVATILHMIFYGTKNYFQRGTLNKDISKLAIILNDRLLNKNSNISIKTDSLKEVAEVLNNVDLKLTNNFQDAPLVASTTKLILDIENGKYVSTKELKLPENSPLAIKNTENRLKSDENFANEVLKNATNFDSSLIETAFNIIVENKPLAFVKKSIEELSLSNAMVQKLLLKDSDQLALTNGEIINYIKGSTLKNSELVEIIKHYEKTMPPEQLIQLFEDLTAQNEYFTSSYLYLLFEYQMIEKAREVLVNSQKDEYVIFKALLDLKESGKHSYSVDNLIFE